MAICTISTESLERLCSTPLSGGVRKTIYVGSLEELQTSINVSTGVVSSFSFDPYCGLRKISMTQKAFQSGYTARLADTIGTIIGYTHTIMLSLYLDSKDDDLTMQSFAKGEDLFFVVPGNDLQIRIYGAEAGCRIQEGKQDSGIESTSDASHKLNFFGEFEQNIPCRFSTTGVTPLTNTLFDSAITLLESYVI